MSTGMLIDLEETGVTGQNGTRIEQTITLLKVDQLGEPVIGQVASEKVIDGKPYALVLFEGPVYSNFPYKLSEPNVNYIKENLCPFYIEKSYIFNNSNQFKILTTEQIHRPVINASIMDYSGKEIKLTKQIPTVANIVSLHGTQYGIQGANNSCYIDVTLLTLFAFSTQLDPTFEQNLRADYDYVFKIIVANEIINELRNGNLVPYQTIGKLRGALAQKYQDDGLKLEQMDAEDFINFFLEKALNIPKFITYKHGHDAHEYIHPITTGSRENSSADNPCRTVKQLLHESFEELDLSFQTFPNPFLILKMPVCDGKLLHSKYIIPNLELKIELADGRNSEYRLHAILCLRSNHYTCFVRFEEEWAYFDSKPTSENVEMLVVDNLSQSLDRLEKTSHRSIDPWTKEMNFISSPKPIVHHLLHNLYICIYSFRASEL